MSDQANWKQVCGPESAVNVDLANFCMSTERARSSPIDDYLGNVASILILGDDVQLKAHEALGRVLLLGIVSAAEFYFRAILALTIQKCPLAKRHASNQTLSLAAVDYHGMENLGYGLLEGVSFSSSGELKRNTKKLTDIDLVGDSIETAISQFESICELRHAAVHSRGVLSSQNLEHLDFPSRQGQLALRLDLGTLHATAHVCQNIVRAYNRFVFAKTVERWIDAPVFVGDWMEDRDAFGPLHRLFYCGTDNLTPRRAYDSYRALQPLIVSRLATR